ncbi:hypothetical protein KP509_1Z011200 [Ceratopteris richardii]|nr:hypothetical protein KP509_1Z011200 [Ceratopteris richardii]
MEAVRAERQRSTPCSANPRASSRHHTQQQPQLSPSPPPDPGEDDPLHQQQVLESLASYLEGELMSRIQAYCELLAEAQALNRERSFYHGKLLQIEKICKHLQSFRPSIPMLEPIISTLSTDTDMPCT